MFKVSQQKFMGLTKTTQMIQWQASLGFEPLTSHHLLTCWAILYHWDTGAGCQIWMSETFVAHQFYCQQESYKPYIFCEFQILHLSVYKKGSKFHIQVHKHKMTQHSKIQKDLDEHRHKPTTHVHLLSAHNCTQKHKHLGGNDGMLWGILKLRTLNQPENQKVSLVHKMYF